MLFDKFKKIIKQDEGKSAPQAVEKTVKGKVVSVAPKKKTVSSKTVSSQSKKTQKINVPMYRVVKRPSVTEKGAVLAEHNKYVLRVERASNKSEIKKAVSALYNVTVERVHIINIPRKKRQRGKAKGYRPGFKKAIVTLKEGDKIEFS